jgi:hypothetical protein
MFKTHILKKKTPKPVQPHPPMLEPSHLAPQRRTPRVFAQVAHRPELFVGESVGGYVRICVFSLSQGYDDFGVVVHRFAGKCGAVFRL